MIDKILICAPTAAAKNYCLQDYLDNVMGFSYPNYDVLLCDNTLDDGQSAQFIRDTFKKQQGETDRFKVIHSAVSGIGSVIQRMSISHNDCRDAMLKGDYKYMFHLESDVFPPKDVIEQLMFHKKKVIGALYYRDEGAYRKLCIQSHVNRSPNNIFARNMAPGEDLHFIDGTIKRVASVGLGAVLIERSVLEKFPFRFEVGHDSHPDSFFSEDCYRHKIDIWADTAIICEHRNKTWGIHGIDFK